MVKNISGHYLQFWAPYSQFCSPESLLPRCPTPQTGRAHMVSTAFWEVAREQCPLSNALIASSIARKPMHEMQLHESDKALASRQGRKSSSEIGCTFVTKIAFLSTPTAFAVRVIGRKHFFKLGNLKNDWYNKKMS